MKLPIQILFAVSAIFCLPSMIGQETTANPKTAQKPAAQTPTLEQTPTAPTLAPPATKPAKPTNKILLITCDAAPGQMVVLNSRGDWLPLVREVSIAFSVNGPVTARCTSWAGIIKPKTPSIEIYDLSQIKSVPQESFDKIISGLQEDMSFIRNSNVLNQLKEDKVAQQN